MEKIIIINGSPRASHSNSRQYAAIFQQAMGENFPVYDAITKKPEEAFRAVEQASDLLLVFPLYADGVPAVLLRFLKELENHAETPRVLRVHVLVNCGFLEPEQNTAALEIIRLFCKKNGFTVGSTLQIGSGEAILTTPFAFLARRKIRQFAAAVRTGRHKALKTTMPLPKQSFIKASTKFWLSRGAQNGVSKEQMETMEIDSSEKFK